MSQALNLFGSYLVISLLFAMILKYIPDAIAGWRDVWIGAAATAALFVVGKWVLGLYLGRGGIGTAFGSAASFVLVLVWIYYSAQLLFLGAEFTQAYASMFGARVHPAPRRRTDNRRRSSSRRPLGRIRIVARTLAEYGHKWFSSGRPNHRANIRAVGESSARRRRSASPWHGGFRRGLDVPRHGGCFPKHGGLDERRLLGGRCRAG